MWHIPTSPDTLVTIPSYQHALHAQGVGALYIVMDAIKRRKAEEKEKAERWAMNTQAWSLSSLMSLPRLMWGFRGIRGTEGFGETLWNGTDLLDMTNMVFAAFGCWILVHQCTLGPNKAGRGWIVLILSKYGGLALTERTNWIRRPTTCLDWNSYDIDSILIPVVIQAARGGGVPQ